jgi:hypothetical protein
MEQISRRAKRQRDGESRRNFAACYFRHRKHPCEPNFAGITVLEDPDGERAWITVRRGIAADLSIAFAVSVSIQGPNPSKQAKTVCVQNPRSPLLFEGAVTLPTIHREFSVTVHNFEKVTRRGKRYITVELWPIYASPPPLTLQQQLVIEKAKQIFGGQIL